MGYLLFLPFLLHAKGGNEATLGIGLALIFAGAPGQGMLRLARPTPRRGSLRDRHGGGDCPLHGVDVDVAARTSTRPPSISGNRSQRHVVGPLRDRSGTGGERRARPSLRAVLHWRHWGWRIGADRVRRDCRPFQQNYWRRRSSPDSGCHHPYGSRPASPSWTRGHPARGAGGTGTRVPSFSARGGVRRPRAERGERHPAVVRAFVLQYTGANSSGTGPRTLPELAANGRPIFAESAAARA